MLIIVSTFDVCEEEYTNKECLILGLHAHFSKIRSSMPEQSMCACVRQKNTKFQKLMLSLGPKFGYIWNCPDFSFLRRIVFSPNVLVFTDIVQNPRGYRLFVTLENIHAQ